VHIFVSYSRADVDYVRVLLRHLRAQGLQVWADDQISPGERWDQRIRQNIDGCAAMILVMSPHSDVSEWVAEEVDYARRKNKPILPLLLAGDVFFGMGRTHYEEVKGGSMPSQVFIQHLRTLVASGSGRDLNPQVIPLYLVYNTSLSMAGDAIRAVNGSIDELFTAIPDYAGLADRLRICILSFNVDAHHVLPLSRFNLIEQLPIFTAVGVPRYAPIFRLLRKVIESDCAELVANGYSVQRPAVFFYTSGEPSDQDAWPERYRALTDADWNLRPRMAVFGWDDGDRHRLQQLSTRVEPIGGAPHRLLDRLASLDDVVPTM
jgi:uncharacterized protein YegL